ncbi:MAG: S46 family peptidase, partial [Flavobacteriales bacterium]|nr:S46 family peptidase [Flavobacteriales bacterium]
MKKVFMLLFIAAFSFQASAHEGMWLMQMLKRINEAEMQNLGLNLTAEEIYDINNASLKDAIVRLNGGMCTAEVISDQGLVLTNHHCAYGAIQSFSSAENDYLTDGFWAKKLEQEMHIEDFEVSFLVRIDDVTSEVLAGVNESMSEEERNTKIQEKIAELSSKAGEGTNYDIEIKSFFYGNEYYQFTYNTYKDIRLVGAPPESVGKFGGDTDNWMWPRHTGDFSLIRIYSDADNNPAGYSADNKPYTPKRHLKVSLDGVAAGDFAMIMGYPGSTDRFLSSYGVEQAINLYNPTVVEIRDLKLKTMKKHMDEDLSVRIKYASKYASTANYWKYYIGQTKGLKRLDVYGQKKALEDKFREWVAQDNDRKNMYGEALNMIEDYYKSTDATVKSDVYTLEAGLIGSGVSLFGFRVNSFLSRMESASSEEEKAQWEGALMGRAEEFFKDYDAALEKDVFIQLMNLYKKNIPADQLPSVFALIDKKYKGSVERFADKMFASSIVTDKARLMAYLEKPNAKKYAKDLGGISAASLAEAYFNSGSTGSQEKFDKGYRLFVKGLREMMADKNFSPDANSTMRLTYGIVDDYFPADGVHYDFITTTKGILEKED